MNLLLLFTWQKSLKFWNEKGIIEREFQLYKRLNRRGIDITFLTYGEKSDSGYVSQIDNFTILPCRKYIFSRYRAIRFLKSLILPIRLREVIKKVDIIKSNQLDGSWVAWLAKILYRRKIVIRGGYEWLYFHIQNKNFAYLNSSFKFWIKYFYRYLIEWISYKLADLIILTSNLDIEFIVKKFGIKKKKIRLLPNYVDTAIFKPNDAIKKSKNIVFIGRLVYQKNIVNLVKVISDIDETTLDIIGEGPLEKKLEVMVKSKPNINLIGVIPHEKIPEAINQHEIFILPSFYEGNPKTLLEAMSCGIACIGTDVPGIKSVISHLENGFLCSLSIKSLKNAIYTLIEDKYLRKKLGNKARKYILSNYSINSIEEKEYLYYKSLLKR